MHRTMSAALWVASASSSLVIGTVALQLADGAFAWFVAAYGCIALAPLFLYLAVSQDFEIRLWDIRRETISHAEKWVNYMVAVRASALSRSVVPQTPLRYAPQAGPSETPHAEPSPDTTPPFRFPESGDAPWLPLGPRGRRVAETPRL
jgi:hypothetical protein